MPQPDRVNRNPSEANRLASQQHGVLSYQQLTELGIDQNFINKQCRNGEWHRVCKTVWTVAGSPNTVQRQLWTAFLSKDQCFISGRSAAAIHQFSGFIQPRLPEITIPYSGDARSRVARVTRSQFFPTTRRVTLGGLEVAAPAETLFVVAQWVDPQRTNRITDDLLMRDPTALAEIQEIYLRYQGHRMRGMATLRPIILERSGQGYVPPESELEALAWRVFSEATIPEMQRQAPLPWAPGAGRVDLFVEAWKLIVELDGRTWHTKTEDFERDRSRDNAAVAAGFAVLRFTWEALTNDPARCVRTIEEFGRRSGYRAQSSNVHTNWNIAS